MRYQTIEPVDDEPYHNFWEYISNCVINPTDWNANVIKQSNYSVITFQHHDLLISGYIAPSI